MPRPLLTTIGCCTQTTARVCITAKDGLAHARIAFRSGENAFRERTLRWTRPAGSNFLHGTFELDGLVASSTVEYAGAVSSSPEALSELEELRESNYAEGLERPLEQTLLAL